MSSTTPLMGLILPTVGPGGDAGPTYATLIVDAFTTLDSHNHATGNGAQIGTAGILIDADIGFEGYNLQGIRGVRLNSQTAVLTAAADLRMLYSVNGELYFRDGSGNNVPITAAGGINAASIGGIGGDYATSNASVAFSDTTKVYNFLQASGIRGKMAFADFTVYEAAAISNGVGIKSPAALAAAYTLTLPADLPADDLASSVLAVTVAGVLSATQSPILVTPQIRDTAKDHSYVFGVSELAANRTITLPLLLGNDVFVFADFIQTLTNKTLASPVFSGNITGVLSQDDTTDSTSTVTGSIHTDGGLGVAKALWVGGLANIAGAATLQSTLAVTGIATFSGGLIGEASGVALKFKVLDIGDWNMDATGSVTIASATHGITNGKVRFFCFTIRADSGLQNMFTCASYHVGTGWELRLMINGSNDIILSREAGGTFDNTNYDETSYNRGWLMIWYTP